MSIVFPGITSLHRAKTSKMTHLYKIGLKETQLVTVLQENIDERPGFTLVPVKYEQCKMNEIKANIQRDREIYRIETPNVQGPRKAKTASETKRTYPYTFWTFWTFKVTN